MNSRQIVTDALGLLGAVAVGQRPGIEDYTLGLRVLDGVLKELPLYGYAWPNLLINQAVTWSSGATVNLPSDYASDLYLTRDSNGTPVPLNPLSRAAWLGMPDRNRSGVPTHFFEDTAGVAYLWPIPTVDPGLLASYTAKPDAISSDQPPDVPDAWCLALSYGLAVNLAPHFGKDPMPLLAIWAEKRTRMLGNGVSTAPVTCALED